MDIKPFAANGADERGVQKTPAQSRPDLKRRTIATTMQLPRRVGG
jgi:hypothetical protein